MSAPLLIEIGCEEIPARMIPRAAADLAARVQGILEQAGLGHGEAEAWGGTRRLAVRVGDVQERQPDREEQVTGPPLERAYDADGKPTPAAAGFARKQGIDPSELATIETDRGKYVGFQRQVKGKSVAEILAEKLPASVAEMTFPKIMRWGEGRARWVRPVHWVLGLYGEDTVPLEIFGIESGTQSEGHRFLAPGPVAVAAPSSYLDVLESAYVVIDPRRRRSMIEERLAESAQQLGGRLVDDPELLDEVADLVEWPGVVAGTFDEGFLELPGELLATTLRHHQKCFSVTDEAGRPAAGFLAVANTDRDPSGHVRRGNEWVINGRLEDARFFWNEDRKRPLADRSDELQRVVLHAKLGSYGDKAQRMAELARALADHVGIDEAGAKCCEQAARLAKNDLVTGTVGEFPELQGQIGGLMLEAEGASSDLARAVYEHYRPTGPSDPVPSSDAGAVVALADKLDTSRAFVSIGKAPTGAGDPFGLRRAMTGAFRILVERQWNVSLADLTRLTGGDETLAGFFGERFQNFLRDQGATANEIQAVLGVEGVEQLPLHDLRSRVDSIGMVRARDDFARLVELTKRVDNILTRNGERIAEITADASGAGDDPQDAARELSRWVETHEPTMAEHAREKRYDAVIESLAQLIDPVARFFDDVLVIDPEDPAATRRRWDLLTRLRAVLTSCFDIRELAGQADRRS